MLELLGLLSDLYNDILKALNIDDVSNIPIKLALFGAFLSSSYLYRYHLIKQKQKSLIKRLKYFRKGYINKALETFVKTNYIKRSPSEYIAKGIKSFFDRKDLIKYLINERIQNNKDDSLYIAVLGDSGIGKTTFLINLFYRYRVQFTFIKKIKDFFYERYEMEFISLKMEGVIDTINKIENKPNCILLLDALDEDPHAVQDSQARLSQIVNVTNEFRLVIITCRTHFFFTEEFEPKKTTVPTLNQNKFYHQFEKLYIAPFSDDDVTKYISKTNPILNIKRRFKLLKVAKGFKDIIVRPLLLSYLGDLVDSDKNFSFTYTIYEEIVEKWIEREAHAIHYQNNSGDNSIEHLKDRILRFSKYVAFEMISQNSNGGHLYIPHSEIEALAERFSIDLKKIFITSNSLLSRDSLGNYMFCHKSFLEYFLALEVFAKPMLRGRINLIEFDLVQKFTFEMGIGKGIFHFYEKHPDFELWYCTGSGFYGKCYTSYINEDFVKNVRFIMFDEKHFIEDSNEITGLISSFSYLNLFKDDRERQGSPSSIYLYSSSIRSINRAMEKGYTAYNNEQEHVETIGRIFNFESRIELFLNSSGN